MTDDDNRRNQMFVRVREFSTRHSADFSQTSVTHQLFSDLTTEIENIDAHATNQTASAGHAEHRTELRGNARRALRDDLEAIYRAARAMGVETNFPLPAPGNDNALLRSARAFAVTAAPLSAEFIAHEMPENFLADLTADADAFEAAMTAQGNAVADRVSAGAALSDAIDRGLEIVRKLKDLIRIKYANDPVVLAEWTTASHIERAPRRAAAAGTTPPGGSSPPTGSSSTPPAGGGAGGTSSSGGSTVGSGGSTGASGGSTVGSGGSQPPTQ